MKIHCLNISRIRIRSVCKALYTRSGCECGSVCDCGSLSHDAETTRIFQFFVHSAGADGISAVSESAKASAECRTCFAINYYLKSLRKKFILKVLLNLLLIFQLHLIYFNKRKLNSCILFSLKTIYQFKNLMKRIFFKV